MGKNRKKEIPEIINRVVEERRVGGKEKAKEVLKELTVPELFKCIFFLLEVIFSLKQDIELRQLQDRLEKRGVPVVFLGSKKEQTEEAENRLEDRSNEKALVDVLVIGGERFIFPAL